jgi:hypothetical protein
MVLSSSPLASRLRRSGLSCLGRCVSLETEALPWHWLSALVGASALEHDKATVKLIGSGASLSCAQTRIDLGDGLVRGQQEGPAEVQRRETGAVIPSSGVKAWRDNAVRLTRTVDEQAALAFKMSVRLPFRSAPVLFLELVPVRAVVELHAKRTVLPPAAHLTLGDQLPARQQLGSRRRGWAYRTRARQEATLSSSR